MKQHQQQQQPQSSIESNHDRTWFEEHKATTKIDNDGFIDSDTDVIFVDSTATTTTTTIPFQLNSRRRRIAESTTTKTTTTETTTLPDLIKSILIIILTTYLHFVNGKVLKSIINRTFVPSSFTIHHNHRRRHLFVHHLFIIILAIMSSFSVVTASTNNHHFRTSSPSSSPFSSSSSSLSSEHSIIDDETRTKYSNIDPHSNRMNINNNKFQLFEKQFLQIMGLNARPRPENYRKVPEYMFELYKWFDESRDQQIDDDEDDNIVDDDLQIESPKTYDVALTSEDLWHIHHKRSKRSIENHRLDRFNTNNDHQIHQRKRGTQPPRVSLTGPAHTIISHPLDNHNHDKINRRTKRDSSKTNRSIEEAHLTFNLTLPFGEMLQGAELRLYRNSIYETNNVIRNKTRASTRRWWSPHHWSIRYRSSSSSSSLSSIVNSQKMDEPMERRADDQQSTTTSSTNINMNESQYQQRINVYHLLRPIDELHLISNTEMTPILKLIDTQVIDVRHSGWLSFDIKPAIECWLADPSVNFGLLVTFTDKSGRNQSSHSNLVIVNQEDSIVQSMNVMNGNDDDVDEINEWHELQPMVVTFSSKHGNEKRKHHSRVKRDHHHQPNTNPSASSSFPTPPTRTNSNKYRMKTNNGRRHRPHHTRSRKPNARGRNKSNDRCARQPLYFDFQTVGWTDWVVSPSGFPTYFCQGECSYPLESHLNYTNHATIQAILNSMNPASVPLPCCVPTDLSPITLLYYDVSGNIVVRRYHDMVVEGCGCR